MMTSEISTLEPLRKSVTVKKPQREAFALFTEGVATWWPLRTHSVFEDDAVTCVFESGKGGRIFERTMAGAEHDWGEVTIWEPPTRLGYLWHLRQDPAVPSEVEIRFVPEGQARTRVEIEHRGWERLGADAQTWRDRNLGGWSTLLPHYLEAVRVGR